jgi:hypothetical protein
MTGSPRSDPGFVLPSVLAYIAAFTLVILIAAGSLERSRTIALSLDRSVRLSGALDETEALATFTFLTSPPVPGGLDMSGRIVSAESVLLGLDDTAPAEPSDPASIWSASGGARLASLGPVRSWVIYQDVSGLVSLNTSDPDLLAGVLKRFDVRRDDAARMAATLADYEDDDHVRRPQGAERADYRLRKLAPPANAPIRSPAELGQVFGWQDFEHLSDLEFLSLVTPSPTQNQPRTQFAPAEIKALIAERRQGLTTADDPLTEAIQTSLLPSNRARFILVAQDEPAGLYRVRLVEIQRQPTASARPYSRSLLSETTVTSLPENWQPGADAQKLDPAQSEDR